MCFHDIMNHHDIFEAFWHRYPVCFRGMALELEAPPIYYNKAGAVSITTGHIMGQDGKMLGLKWFVLCFLFLVGLHVGAPGFCWVDYG